MSKKKFTKSTLVLYKLLLALTFLLVCATFSYGATPAGYSEYYIPGDEDLMRIIWGNIGSTGGVPTTMPNAARHTIISVVAWSDNTKVYYDHWENGYNFDPNNPATADETYTLNKGQSHIFESNNIPVNPRGAVQYYDGGDRIYVAGGSVSVTRMSWIDNVGTVFSIAMEVYPIKPQMTTYVLPFGEDLAAAPRNYRGFDRVFALVQATQDNTTVQFDFNGDGTFDTFCTDKTRATCTPGTQITLNRGQSFLLDDFVLSPQAAPYNAVHTGTVIKGSSTVQVTYIIGNHNDTYQGRAFAAFPRGFWDTEYYSPLDSSNGTATYPTNVYLYNPNNAAITIDYQTTSGSGSFSLPANSTRSFQELTGNYVPLGSGIYLKGSDVFWGVATNDDGIRNGAAQDGATHEWGYSLIPAFLLGNEQYIGWAPSGTTPSAANANDAGIFITPSQDNTRVFVDTNNDGVADQTFTLDRMQTQYVFNATTGDMSNSHIWASGPIALAYGQNSALAPTGAPAIDVGYGILPGGDWIDKVLTVSKTANPVVVSTTSGSTSTYTLTVNSYYYAVNGISVVDTLPAGWQYVNNSATITLADKTTSSANPTIAGQTLTWSSALLGGMAANQNITITFTARTTQAFNVGDLTMNQVVATGTRTVGGLTQTFVTSDFAFNTYAASNSSLTVAKSSCVLGTSCTTLTDPLYPGNSFTYKVQVTNPASSTANQTGIAISDPLPSGVSYVAGSGSVTCQMASNVRDEFAAVAYTNNGPNNTASWSGAWTETDNGAGTAGATGGFVWITGNQLQFRYVLSTFGDQFASQAYNLNTGTVNWTGNWTESATLDGSATTIANQQIYITNNGNRYLTFDRSNSATTFYIRRTASVTTGSTVTIQFVPTDAGAGAGEAIIAEYQVDGTGAFIPLGTFDGGTAGWSGNQQTYTINNFPGTSITLQFRATAVWNNNNDMIYIDNVLISYNAVGTQIQRTANLTGATSAMLSFSYSSAGLVAGDTLVVEASSSAAGPFTTLATFAGGMPNVAPPYNITAYISANTTIRFRIIGGFGSAGKTFNVDNVDITYGVPSTFAAGSPPNFLSSATGCLIGPNNSLSLTYNVTVDNPLATGINQITNTAYVNSNEIILPLSASVTNIVSNPSSGSAEVGDRVWLDANGNGSLDLGEPGLANVEVKLKDRFGATVLTTTTDATGHYLFTGVQAGTGYYIELTSGTLPSGLQQSAPAGHADNRTGTFDLNAGQSYKDADLGYKSAPGIATIGNYVWSDANADNRRNAGEPGLAGVAVQLWRDVNGNGIKDAGDALCTSGTCGTNGTTTTAPDGSYLFTGVTAGGTEDYIVYIDEAQAALSGYTRTSPPGGSALFSIINITSGASILYANFGYQGTTYSIIDRVWFDVNGDKKDDVTAGDNAEVGLSGVTVDLVDASLNAIATTTTDANGYFSFTGVVGGGADYTIKITDTDGKLTDYFGTTPAAIAGQKGVVNLAGNIDYTVEPTQPDFGYGLKGAIGSWVYNDANSNSTHDAGEGISGVTVKLYKDVNANGVINSPADTLVATLTTDSTGRYIFSGLADGSYIVSIESPPGGYAYFGTDSDTVTTGQQLPATISGGGNSLAIDFGYRASTPHSVSGTLWEDTDKDGVIDSGEVGISGVTIDLLNASLTVVATTTTDAYGSYSFNGIPSGNPYYVKITDNDGVLTGYTATWEKTELLTGPFNGQETVNLTSDRTGINFGYYNPVPTLVVVSYFGAYEKDGQVVVKWETASEINTLGFNLLRLDPLTGEYKQVNPGLLPSMLKPHRGGKYTFKDTGALPGKTYTYKLMEVEVSGNELSYGPFAVFPARIPDGKGLDLSTNADYGRTERDKPEMHKVRTDGRKSRQPGNVKTGSGERIKISVTDNGIYYVDAQDISLLLGISTNKIPSMISQGQLSLSNQGKQVAYLPAANNAGLYFYGTGIDSIYTKENVYWIDKGAGTLMPVVKGTGPAPSPEGGSFTETVHFEEDVIPWETLFNDPNVDYWFWNQIFASSFYTDPARSFTFQPLGPAPRTTAVIQVHLFGASDAGVTNDHHVVVSLNGQSAEGLWSGLKPHTITGTFPLQSGENTIMVAATADEGVSSSFILIDSFDVTYKRLYDADGDNLFFRGEGAPSVTIGGFTSAGIKVFDLTNPLIPKFNTATAIGASSAPGTASYTVSLKPASANTPYLAVASSGIKAASSKTAFFSTLSLKQNSADYIVIAPPELVSTAQDLANYRAGQGMKTMVVNLEDIMNEFNYGISSPEAIKKFLSNAYSKWKKAPHYVVLAGDGSSDYKDNLGFGGNLIPSKMVPTDFGLAMSDNFLADINGDHLPEIAIGRLPVVNPDELKAVIGKIKTFERTLGNSSVILVADTPDNGGDFIAGSEALAGLFPSGYTVSRINLDDPAMVDAKRAALISAINQGATFFNYVGHAGPDQLSNSGLLSHYPYPEYNPPTDDLPSLTNSTILPVMVAMTCGLNNFSDPYQDVLSEALLLKPDGGVAAAWSATGLSDDAQAGILNREFYKAVFSGKKVLGDAVLQALSAYKKQGTMPFMMDTYCILGDPALRMR